MIEFNGQRFSEIEGPVIKYVPDQIQEYLEFPLNEALEALLNEP